MNRKSRATAARGRAADMPDPLDPAAFSALLDELLQLPAEDRARWVEALPEPHRSFQPRLRRLLARASQPGARSLGTLPKDGAAVQAAPVQEAQRIGPYQLLRPLGRGGMASVWLAREERAQGERHVALKLAHVSSPHSGFAERFEREQQLLAALDHPNIARFYEAGTTPEQQLYLVLEHVEGLPLDVYCRERNASLAQRFALVLQIADALTHAHERRIVHRDLKPSNVLVTAGGETRLLDFGVAKLLTAAGAGDDAQQLSSFYGRPITPEYASPEQLMGGEIGFASDVYSLGVIWYELATGMRPYTCKPGSNRALREAILHAPPLLPSRVARELQLRPLLDGAIDASLLRALHKDPARRHGSMRELAIEIEQHTRTLSRLQLAR